MRLFAPDSRKGSPGTEQQVAVRVFHQAGLPSGDIVQMTHHGRPALILVRRIHAECERRRVAGLGAVTDRDLLRLLSRLPVGEPVTTTHLTAAEMRLIHAAPDAVIATRGSSATRLLRQPIEVHAAQVFDRKLGRGLDRASTFAGFCPRIAVLTAGAGDLTSLAHAEASMYGIGVADAHDPAKPVLMTYPDLAPKPPGPVSWRFAERVYESTRAASTAS